ncbi:MAG TPA: malto-oligosyltrehalose synthase [Verrucomicrobiota bacterium]|nr:malto-oligosyltrehalose synthase [Verrucomicrobiota bacterium]HNU49651.1 malto-oligosyltrehalose synthase [Verrucomicrobiota bacterium]
MKTRAQVPRATYRLQLHRGFTLRQAIALVPYLDALGVSHIYASPLLKARPGSTHGYDVCDPTRLNPELGTEADLEALAAALGERGMGLVADIVPNHMAAVPENPWWRDVLEHGRASRYADYFDIDWDPPDAPLRGKVLLPVLDDEFDRVLARGQLNVVCEAAEVAVRYGDQRFPVSPESILVPGRFLEEAVAEFNADPKAMARFLAQQHYRLACWRQGDSLVNYRRFFTLTHLVGLRVEVPQVFADAHNRILDWHQRGLLDGLRVDHPDGLRDPQGYLRRLRQAAPGAWIVVEKILEPGEGLSPDWPVAGTTGYDFLNRVAGLFIDPQGATPLTDFYVEFTGEPADFGQVLRDKKRWILRHQLVAEINRLVRLLESILADHAPAPTISREQLREALVELMAVFPVYRTYHQAGQGIRADADQARGLEALTRSLDASSPPSPAVLAFLTDLLECRVTGSLAGEFVMRFQQLTGPAMAKGKEDTAYYCYNRFIALNEVGGDPGRFGHSVEDFHQASGLSLAQWPAAMLATSTHDTKRSEDIRARLALLSEIPERWIAAVRRWSAMNDKHRRHGWPDRNAEYLWYQMLVGAWPLPLDRALACLEKSAREAKQFTSWHDPNAAYEAALKGFAAGTLSDPEFLPEVERFVASLVSAGYVNSLAQTLLKLTAPGVPDLYQGTELWDLSLVDPDNRRPVDFAPRRTLLDALRARPEAGEFQGLLRELLENPADGRVKLFVIHRTLQHRRRYPALFQDGHYVPLYAAGRHAGRLCAFARVLGGATAIVAVPRLVLGLTADSGSAPLGERVWADTRLLLPGAQGGGCFRNVCTGEIHQARPDGERSVLGLAEILNHCPVALLEKVPAPVSTASIGVASL